jgi:hypothetical protein
MSRYTIVLLVLLGLLALVWWAARIVFPPDPEFEAVLWSFRSARIAFGVLVGVVVALVLWVNRIGLEIEANRREWQRMNEDIPELDGEGVRYEIAAATAQEALRLVKEDCRHGKAECFGRLLFLILDSYREVDRRLGNEHLGPTTN